MMNPIQNHGAAINARRRRFMISQFLQMMKPPKAGERNRLPMIAMTGLQIVSPCGGTAVVAGIVDAGPVTKLGSGGGPAAGIGIDGKGGGVDRGAVAFDSPLVAASSFASDAEAGTGSGFAAGNAARNSEIGFQADFVSSQ